MTTKEALLHLDPKDDAQWTSDGLPLVDVVRGLTGNQELTRKEITEADPSFCREKASTPEVPPAKPKTRDEALLAEMTQLEAELNELTRQQSQIEGQIVDKQRRWSVIRAHFDRQQSGSKDMQARIDYIKRQAELRAERAQKSKELLKGLDPKLLSGQAPLDAAMARKNTRGTMRPVVPVTPEQQPKKE